MRISYIAILAFICVLSACTHFQPEEDNCTIRSSSCTAAIYAGQHTELVAEAAHAAKVAVNTTEFRVALASFIETDAQQGAHAAAWADVRASQIIEQLDRYLDTASIRTYGGFSAFVQNRFSGNLAREGSASGPILLNAWGLPRPMSSVASSIVHEASHRIGLRHPHCGKRCDWPVARCEPPYVIGSMIEQLITHPNTSATLSISTKCKAPSSVTRTEQT